MKFPITTFLFVLIFAVGLFAQDRQFIGTSKCKTCHKKAEKGDQYGKWSKGVHATAYKTLSNDASKKIAKEKGIADATKAPECLKCHVTAAGVDAKLLGKKHKIEDGVGCESCHGAGGDYYKKKTMKAIYDGTQDGAALGLLEPNEKLCVTCHNPESPTHKEFKFAERIKEVAHPMPKK